MAISTRKKIVTTQGTERSIGQRSQAIVLFCLSASILLGFLGSRLAYLQLVEGDRNRELADENRIRLIAKAPERGRILDRNGKLLATSRLAHSLYLWPIAQPEEEWPTTIAKLAEILDDITAEEIRQKLDQEGYDSPNLVRIATALSPRIVTHITEHNGELPGVQISPEAVRYYPNGDIAAHVLGYTGEITPAELEKFADQFSGDENEDGKSYRLQDVVGKSGIESAFETQLRGVWGGQQVEVDAVGKVLQVLGQKPPQPGNAVYVTIDLELQKAAELALGDLKGAVVAMNPQNGEILAMVSHPNFDPNIFSTRISEKTWAQLQAKENPFVNRALRAFPPASTYKIITTAAALESGGYSPNDYLNTFAYLSVGGIQFWDHNNAGFGVIGFAEAMAYSSDTFFYQVGRKVGVDALAEWSRKFSYGSRTGIELVAEESKGLVPDPAWKEEVIGEQWYVGNTINMSIGQGDLQASLLQVALMTAVPANGGYMVRPHLRLDDVAAKTWRKSLDLKPSTVAILQQGLRDVMTYGTGQGLNIDDIVVTAGKSGTAEDPPRENHVWFTVYGPYDNPEILVVAFGENSGGGGSSIAGPIAMQVMKAYFQPEQAKQEQEEAKKNAASTQ
ncbi:peptidoglycan glycosyltransferase [Thalassoporum mexicanum PCC 7367]|uniref:penicillin-binding protein 2 n=1 Tax=Thalassoporum mexicanum TaxID=3457544 RepID=UPI00029FF06F|nr:penicillin-binding protein 2 [Pseudanabaena sp. PCC 7367]AFY70116.1 peptidoglycan glycosyltransferase [Pseudanabaena sp. PCC 7367]